MVQKVQKEVEVPQIQYEDQADWRVQVRNNIARAPFGLDSI